MKSYIVIGLGRFGGALARQLCTLGAEVLAMDRRSDLVQQLANDVTHAVVGDARDKEVLRALGVRNFDCAVIAIGDDLAASVLITMNLKELGAPYIVCKAHDETHRLVLEKLGADRVVIPEQEHAQRLARSMYSHNVLDYIELSEDYGILEVPAPKSWIGKCINELNVRAKLGVNIIAVDLRARMPHVRQKLGVPSRRRQCGDMSGEVYALQKLPDDRHRHGGPRHRRHQPDPRYPRRPRGYYQSGGRLLPGTGCGTLYPVHGILRHLPPVRHRGRPALPPSGADAPLRGKSGHQHYSHAGALRDRVPVRGQCCDVDFFAAFLKNAGAVSYQCGAARIFLYLPIDKGRNAVYTDINK